MIVRSGVNILNPGPNNTTNLHRCSSDIDCALLNPRSLKAIVNNTNTNQRACKLTLFKNYVYTNTLDIIAVTDTWLTDNVSDGEILGNDYTIYRRDRVGKTGGGVFSCWQSNRILLLSGGTTWKMN